MLARYLLSKRVRPSVCLSVRPPQAGILAKRLNIVSQKTTPHKKPIDSSFMMQKTSTKLNSDGIIPNWGAKFRWDR